MCEPGLKRPTPEALSACPLLFPQLDVLMYCCGLGHWQRVQSTYVSDHRSIHPHLFDPIATVVLCCGREGGHASEKTVQYRSYGRLLHIHTYIYIYVYIYVCVCVCVQAIEMCIQFIHNYYHAPFASAVCKHTQ